MSYLIKLKEREGNEIIETLAPDEKELRKLLIIIPESNYCLIEVKEQLLIPFEDVIENLIKSIAENNKEDTQIDF